MREVLSNVLKYCNQETSNYLSASFELAWTFYRLNNFEEAKDLFNTAINEAERQDNESLKARGELGLGLILWREGNLSSAEQYFHSSLSTLANGGCPRSIAQAANNLGIIYYQDEIMDKAEIYFKRAIDSFKEIGEEDNLRNVINNLGYLYYQKKEFSKSITKYKELISLVMRTNDDSFLSTAYSGLAASYLELEKIDTAFMYADRARTLVDSLDDSAEYGISLRILGDISRLRKEFDQAHKLYNNSISILDKSKEKEEMEIAIEGLKKLELAEN